MKRKLLIIFSIIAILLMLYCIGAYIYLQQSLVPSLAEPTALMQTIGNICFPALLIVGFYHIVLLVRKLKSLTGRFLDAAYVVMIVLSGITLLSDLTFLMDIGKEYRLFDVTGEWLMLYGFTAFQLITVVIGFVPILKKEPIKAHLFRIDSSEQENLFLSMHHIALVCGALGLIGVALSMTGLIVPLQFRTALMIVVSVLVICPLVLIILYWLISMAKSRRGEWTDEKQRADTGRAAIAALIVYLAGMVAVVIITALNAVNMPLSFWLLSVFFMMMTAFSGVIIKRNA